MACACALAAPLGQTDVWQGSNVATLGAGSFAVGGWLSPTTPATTVCNAAGTLISEELAR